MLKSKRKKLNSAEKRPVGRPRVDRQLKFIRTFETTKPLDDRLKFLAEENNKTVSAVIREILERFFEER